MRKVFVTAFSSDRIGVFAGTAASPTDIQSWTRRTIDYASAPVGGNARWGPRGMVLGTNQGGATRLYVVNRLDNSVSVFDVSGRGLAHAPRRSFRKRSMRCSPATRSRAEAEHAAATRRGGSRELRRSATRA